MRPFAQGLGFRPGSGALLLVRIVALLLLGAVGAAVASSAIAEEYGSVPAVLATGDSPTANVALGILASPPSAFLGLAGLAFVLFLILDQLMTGAALRRFAPDEPEPTTAWPWQVIWRDGAGVFWPFLRVTVLCGGLIALGAVLISLGMKPLFKIGFVQGWTGLTRLIELPALAGALGAVWALFVGVFGTWCRLLIVADGRRRVRRVAWHAFRLMLRAPVRSTAVFVVVALLLQLAGAALLALGRPGIEGPLYAPFLVVVVLSAGVWHWRLHAARCLYAEATFDRIRAGSDEPYGIFGWIWRKLRPPRAIAPSATGDPVLEEIQGEPSSI